MKFITLNDQHVQVEIIPGDLFLTIEEILILERLDLTLRNSPEFLEHHNDALLTRIDSMRVLKDTRPGRYRMRYMSGANILEFWGHVAPNDSINMKHKIVTVTRDHAVDTSDKETAF